MATKIEVPWGDSTNDKFYIDFIDIQKREVLVTSDPNSTGLTRKKEILITTNNDNPNSKVYMKIVQEVHGTGLPLVTFNKVVAIYKKIKVITYQ